MNAKEYQSELEHLQVELAKLQHWVQASGARIVVLFEGRDAAGKGGAIKRITERMNPRVSKVVALAAPNEQERTQWYFQRYVANLPSAGQIVLFDRSWYNRAGVERVMGFCTDDELQEFLRSCPEFERMLIRSGIQLIKYWFSVSDEEQERRLQSRLADPDPALEALADGPRGAAALGRVLQGQRRDVHLYRHQAVALVRGALRRQAGGAAQLHPPLAEPDPLRRSRSAHAVRAPPPTGGHGIRASAASTIRPTYPRSIPDPPGSARSLRPAGVGSRPAMAPGTRPSRASTRAASFCMPIPSSAQMWQVLVSHSRPPPAVRSRRRSPFSMRRAPAAVRAWITTGPAHGPGTRDGCSPARARIGPARRGCSPGPPTSRSDRRMRPRWTGTRGAESRPMVAAASTMTRSAQRTTIPSSIWCTSRGPTWPEAHGRWSWRDPMTT